MQVLLRKPRWETSRPLKYAYVGERLDHIGVVAVENDHVLSAEGNNDNRTGVFARTYAEIEGYVRLPDAHL